MVVTYLYGRVGGQAIAVTGLFVMGVRGIIKFIVKKRDPNFVHREIGLCLRMKPLEEVIKG